MSDSPAYTRSERNQAVNLAAFLGWVVVAVPLAFTTFNPLVWVYAAVIGLPVSFVLCWLIGAPILTRIMRKPVSFVAAARWGATIAAVIYILYLCVFTFIYGGTGQDRGPDLGSQFEEANSVISVGYVLARATPLVFFSLLGAIIGISVRWAIGAGTAKD
ncbi:hypothetical protein [Paracoccus sp. IB05]|uniref:hypothetical protein n=1 Tax=Paracoccus sp. IB05 TaxID=2779367 RepID=UPI0018E87107|nr:hypothetical protein [Paracoccus sp. IB05]MBJ2153809.1 hypothetical protein [Paracoccus sp. IB05]